MKNIPFLEWPERSNTAEEEQVTDKILNLLKQQIESQLQDRDLIFLITPHPARNINLLEDELAKVSIDKKNSYHIAKYGYKNRGWATIFKDIDLFKDTLPLFFYHGAENLIIAGMDNNKKISENPELLATTINNLVFEDNKESSPNSYVGLFFECNRLISFV